MVGCPIVGLRGFAVSWFNSAVKILKPVKTAYWRPRHAELQSTDLCNSLKD